MSAAGRQSSTRDFALRKKQPRSRKPLYLKSVLGLVGVLVIGGGLWWLGHSSVFAVERVESGSYRYTSEVELEGVLGSFLGRNIWNLSNQAVRDSMAGLPWVRDLNVRRRLPGSVEVDFREWRPLLLLEKTTAQADQDAGSPFDAQVVVEDGRVLPFPDHLTLPGLPVLVGVPCQPDSTRAGLALQGEHCQLVLDLMAAVEDSGLESVCPVDFIVARADGYAVVLQNGQGRLLLGKEEFLDRLDRYMAARDHLEPGLQMDLRFAERITCRKI